MTTAGSASIQSNTFNRVPYQTTQLSTAVSVNSYSQHATMLARTDRRALGVTPSYNNNSLKHRLGTRRGLNKAPNLISTEGDWRSSCDDPRLYDIQNDSHSSSGTRLRSFSAKGSKLRDSPNGARSNPRAAMTTFGGSHGNISSSEGSTPYNVTQQYACSSFPHPTVTKVTPNQPTLGLSVISGPAPIMNRGDGYAGDHGLPPRKLSNGLTNQGRWVEIHLSTVK